ncbi:MAG: hypothetical protein QOG80_2799 [Pseudonocardiales bacterium]|jgi:GNAT superfamily N-acetyltransferase|nr:hypothetical protein [Pseudonocardiales bacterium]
MTSTQISPCETDRSAVGSTKDDVDPGSSSLAIWVRQPWMVRVGRDNLLIRGTTPRDLTAVAAMHTRCSARSLLERYRAGGRAPSPVAIERALRRTLGFVACTARGEIVAMAVAAPDPTHAHEAAEIGLLVEDGWQRRGVGREMLTHLSGGAYVCGYTQLISYTATSVTAPHRLLTVIGRTYSVPDPYAPHLHTYLTEASTLGLGAVREHMAS